jgi:uncharacterized protein YciI
LDFFVYSRDARGAGSLRADEELLEEHWSYMDGFAGSMIARGPTLTADRETATGSLHVLALPSVDAAHEFVDREPNNRAGVYAEHSVWRFDNLLGRTMWESSGAVNEARFLIIARSHQSRKIETSRKPVPPERASTRTAGVTAAEPAARDPRRARNPRRPDQRLRAARAPGHSTVPDRLTADPIGDDPPGPDGSRLMNQMGRGALRARVTVGNRDVHLLTAHLKSKLLSFPDGFTPADEDQRARYAAYALYRRAAEATTLRSHLNTLLNGAGRLMAVILAGDLNDEVDAATTQILNGPPGSEIGTSGFHRSDRGDGDRLWNLAPRIPVEQRFSRVYRGRQELIDHIFVSNFLVANNRTTVVTTAAAEVPLPSIADDPTARRGKPGSDHSAVIATFDL